MDDWKLKVRTVVKLEREPNIFVSCYRYHFTGLLVTSPMGDRS